MRRIGAIFKPPENAEPADIHSDNSKPGGAVQKPRKSKSAKGEKQCTPTTNITGTSTGEN